MRLDWKGNEHGGPFTGTQIFDLRDLVPEDGTFLPYIGVRRTTPDVGAGSVTASLRVKDRAGTFIEVRATVNLGDDGPSTATGSAVAHKMAKDDQNPESELILTVVPSEDAEGDWTVDVGIP